MTHDDIADPAALLLLLDERETLEESLGRLARTCRDAVPTASDVSVTLARPGRAPRTAAATSDRAQRIDEWEYDTMRGPCIEALRDGGEHYVRSRADAKQYGGFEDVIADAGVSSVLGVPLIVSGEVVGAINVYADRDDAFDDEAARTLVRNVAAQAATAVHNLRVYEASRTLAQQLEEAMASRATIEQAKGVLMAQTGCTADEAFDRLRSASQRENVKLREIADRIVRGVAPG